MEKSARYWIETLGLAEHPEGGRFAPAYRSPEIVRKGSLPRRFPGDRPVVSSIFYLLEKGQFSAFHRIKSVEIWNFCAGGPLDLHVLEPDGNLIEKKLGEDPEEDRLFQAVVEPGCWFAAEISGGADYSLVSCTVVPGFDYQDFELAARDRLVELYPQHREIIGRLTRS